MGSLFSQGGLTNTASVDPQGNPEWFSNRANAALKSLQTRAQGIEPSMADSDPLGNTSYSDASNPKFAKTVQPSFQQAASMGANPGGTNATSPGLNKAGKLMTLLMGGLQGALAGRAASEQAVVQSGGRRSGGAGVGFQAAQAYPWQRAQMNEQLQQEQAKTGLLQAQTRMAGTSMPITLPGGQQIYVPAGQLGQILRGLPAAQLGAQTKKDIAEEGNQSRERIAQSRITAEQLKFAIQNGQVARVTDGVDPSTGQPAKLAYDRMGRSMGVLPGSLPSRAYLPTESDTIEYREDADGNIISLPKQTIRKPLPGAGGGNAPTAAGPLATGGGGPTRPAAPGGGGPRVVAHGKNPSMAVGSMPDGTQVAGTNEELQAAGAKGITKLEGSESAKVIVARQLTSPGGLFDLANKDLAAFKPGELEALSPRWNEFLAGKVGTADQRYVKLRTHVNGLLSTALMQAHVGSRGGEHIMEHFQDLANTGKMSRETLQAALDAEKEYVQEKAMRPKTAATNGPAATHIWTPQGLQQATKP